MIALRWHLLLLLIGLPGPMVVRAQEPTSGRGTFRFEFQLRSDSLAVQLPHRFLQPQSESLAVEGFGPLLRGSDYTLRYAAGVVMLRQFLFNRLPADTARVFVLRAFYRYLPFRLSPSYSRHTVTLLNDSSGSLTGSAGPSPPPFALEEVFGRDIQKSGSLTRGFTVGTNRDLSLSSGFRMQLSGRIATDVEVAASLTDENTPIQPEGTTQTLQEFDNVFVEIKSPSYAATLGDFVLDMQGTEFARLTRKLQGARGTAVLQGEAVRGDALVSGAVTRGKFQTNAFQGSEGVQGPYRLTGREGERSMIVIAGTEKVYVNGELQVRGETNDYVIDYTTGEVRFTTRRLITSASRIVVDFEYADRRYSRSLAAVKAGGSFFDDRGSIAVAFLREADDPDAPIDLVLDDSARQVLAAAGADPSAAVLNGVTRVDSNGQYLRVDTLLADGRAVTFYRFDPGNAAALYTISFSFVGTGKGDYVRRRPGEFSWVAPGGGDYLPVILLPFAQSQQIIDISASAVPVHALTVSGEFARSELDVNRFSRADPLLAGHALHVGATYSPRNVTVGGAALGDFDITLRERFVDSRFTPIDRTNDIEFGRKWGLDSAVAADEEIREASVRSTPLTGLSFAAGYGRIDRGENFGSVRTEGSADLGREGLPGVRYRIERIRTDDRRAGNRGLWIRQQATTSWNTGGMLPSFRFESEDRTLRPFDAAVVNDGSFRYRVFAPGIRITAFGPLALSGEYEWRTDDRATGGALLREARSFTQSYAARLAEVGAVSSSLDLTLRKKTLTAAFAHGNDIRSVLVRNQTRVAPWNRAVDADILYQVATEQSSRLERVFVRVARGAGNYRYRGDLNGNGLADEDEFEPVRFDGDYTALTLPSDDLVPVIDLKTGVRLRLQPSRLPGLEDGWGGAVLNALTSETYVRIEEKSTEPELRRIYLLDFSGFRNPATTLAGSSLFSQDVLVLDGNPLFSSRLRFLQRSGLTRFSSGVERSFVRERSVRLRWQLIPEVAGQLDVVNRNDRVDAGEVSSRSRDVTSNGITLDIAYRPDQLLELGWKLDVAHAADAARTPSLTSDFNGQTLRVVYAFLGAGQARVEAAREEIILNTPVEVFPFELTGGRVAGKTWLWRAAMEYRVTQFLQGTMNYEGRIEGARPPVHTARAEVRAFF